MNTAMTIAITSFILALVINFFIKFLSKSASLEELTGYKLKSYPTSWLILSLLWLICILIAVVAFIVGVWQLI